MARVKLCGACGHHNPLDEMFCLGCGASLAHAETVETTDVWPTDTLTPAAAAPVAAPPTTAPTGTTRETSARLIFDWGEVPLTDRLTIGRDADFSPIWRQLQAFTTVSGRHAEVVAKRGLVVVRHLGRTNPTYVDGRPLETGETAALNDGATVDFSRAVSARFRST